MKENITPIGPKAISPGVLVQEVSRNIAEVKGIVVIEFLEDGSHRIRASLSRAQLAMACLAMDDFYHQTNNSRMG